MLRYLMKMLRYLIAAAVLALGAGALRPALAADVGVSVTIGEPGFYGRIDIGDYPQPRVIYREPIRIERGYVERAPVYLRVPPNHARRWSRHCGQYDACGERVLFVQDRWYQREYVPRYRAHQRDRRDGHEGDRGRRWDRGDDGHRGHPDDRRGDNRTYGRDHR